MNNLNATQIEIIKALVSGAIVDALVEIDSIEKDGSHDDQWQATVVREQFEQLRDIRSKLDCPSSLRITMSEKRDIRALVVREASRLMDTLRAQGGDGPERANFDMLCRLNKELGGWA